MTDARHSRAPLGERHPVFNWEFADLTAMNAATVFSYEEGRIAKLLSDNSYYELTDWTGPTWTQIGGSPGVIGLDANADTILALTGGGSTIGLDTQAANRVWAGPTSGGAAYPTFRSLVLADMPVPILTPTFPADSILLGPTGTEVGSEHNQVSIGANVTNVVPNGITIGFHAYNYAGANDGISVGTYAYAGAVYGVSIGRYASVSGTAPRGVAIGTSASVGEPDTIAIGYRAIANAGNNIAIGNHAYSQLLTENVAIGNYSNAKGSNGVAIGNAATVYAGEAGVAIGRSAYASSLAGQHSAAIGWSASAINDSVAIGRTVVTTDRNIGIGSSVTAVGQKSIVVGRTVSADAASNNAIAIGENILVTSGQASIAIGRSQTIQGAYSVVIGNDSAASDASILIGTGIATSYPYNTVVGHGLLGPTTQGAALFGGKSSVAYGDYSFLTGKEAVTRNWGQISHAGGSFASIGDAQSEIFLSRRNVSSHVDGTWYNLYMDGAAQDTISLGTDNVYILKAKVVGATTGVSQQWAYEITAVVSQTGTTCTIISQSTTAVYESDAAYECEFTNITAASLGLRVRRSGGSDYNIRWFAKVEGVTVGW